MHNHSDSGALQDEEGKLFIASFWFKYFFIENFVEYGWHDMSNMSLVEPEMAEEDADVQMQESESNRAY